MPLFLLIAVVVFADSGLPIFYIQWRTGLNRKPFRIFKFRTMKHGRVTRVGRYLRKTGLDESAQWINVLRGEMSIVGPRPLTPDDIERLGWNQRKMDRRFFLKPGITGLAQLYGGIGERWTQVMERTYGMHAGVWLDLRIVTWSLAVNVFGKPRVRQYLLSKVGRN
mgnify:FL=1